MPNESAKIILAATHSKLSKVCDCDAVEGTVNALKSQFQFRTADWDNTIKTAVFLKGQPSETIKEEDVTRRILDENNECQVPYEVFDGNYFSVGVFGIAEDYRIVSNWMVYKVLDGCFVSGGAPQDPSPSVYEQIMGILNKVTVSSVLSVNKQTGDVVLTAKDIGAVTEEDVMQTIEDVLNVSGGVSFLDAGKITERS